MAQLVYIYNGVSKQAEPFYRDEGFDQFMSAVKKYFDDGRLTKFTRVLKKGTEELQLDFDNGHSAIAFETEMENWLKADEENNARHNIHRVKGPCTY